MKTNRLFLLPCFVFLAASSLFSEVVNQDNNDNQKGATTFAITTEPQDFENANTSPLMMFRGEDENFSNANKTAANRETELRQGEAESEKITEPDELENEGNATINKYLEHEIRSNIYTKCLAEVASLTLNGTITAENASPEAAEWQAATQAAYFSKRKAERAKEKILREIEDARRFNDEAKGSAKEAVRVPLQGSEAEQAIIAATSNYEKARSDYAAAHYKAKKLAGALAEAKLETADANCYAIAVRNTPLRAGAEAELNDSKKKEIEAADALELANIELTAKESILNIVQKKFNIAQQAAKEISQEQATNKGPTAAASIPIIETYNATAAAAKKEAVEASVTATVLKETGEANFDQQSQACKNAQKAWIETAVIYKNILGQVKKNNLLANYFSTFDSEVKEAEAHAATWNAHGLFSKAKKADQALATASTIQEAQAAWDQTMKEYNNAIKKNEQVNFNCDELRNSFCYASSKISEFTAVLEYAKELEEEARNAASIAEEAKQYILTVPFGESTTLWNDVVTKTETAKEAWDLTAALVRERYNQIVPELQSCWSVRLNTIEHEQAKWSSTVLWEQANKIASIAETSKVSAEVFFDTHPVAYITQATALWKAAAIQSAEAANAWTAARDIAIKYHRQASTHFKSWWQDRVRTAETAIREYSFQAATQQKKNEECLQIEATRKTQISNIKHAFVELKNIWNSFFQATTNLTNNLGNTIAINTSTITVCQRAEQASQQTGAVMLPLHQIGEIDLANTAQHASNAVLAIYRMSYQPGAYDCDKPTNDLYGFVSTPFFQNSKAAWCETCNQINTAVTSAEAAARKVPEFWREEANWTVTVAKRVALFAHTMQEKFN